MPRITRRAADDLAGRATSASTGSEHDDRGGPMTTAALPPVVDAATWQRELDALRAREKAATRELDAVAAQRRRLPMVKMPDYMLEGEQGPVRLADVFDGKSQLIVYNHMWFPGEKWQCPGCTGFTSQFTRLEFLDKLRRPVRHRHPGPDRRGSRLQAAGREQDDLVLHGEQPVRQRRRRAARRRIRGQRVPARRRHRVPHLAHRRPRHRAAQSQFRAGRPAALRAAGGVAGLARGLAAVAHLQPVGRLRGHRRGTTGRMRRGVTRRER